MADLPQQNHGKARASVPIRSVGYSQRAYNLFLLGCLLPPLLGCLLPRAAAIPCCKLPQGYLRQICLRLLTEAGAEVASASPRNNVEEVATLIPTAAIGVWGCNFCRGAEVASLLPTATAAYPHWLGRGENRRA